VVSPHYGVSKIKWCLEHLPDVQNAFNDGDVCCGPLASYIVYRLAEPPISQIDPANGSRTLLWNIQTGKWDPDLLSLFGLSEHYLPVCKSTYDQYGLIKAGGRSIPLTVVTGDQSAALYAGGTPDANTAYINMGTGVFIQYPTANRILDVPGLLCSMVYRDDEVKEFVTESTINGASNALMEVEEALGISGEEAERKLAVWFEEYPDPPLFLNGVAGLAAPYWVPDFVSKFIGEAKPEEKILAVAESILFLIKVNIRLMQNNSANISTVRVTGGLSRSDCLCQKLANLLQMSIVRSDQAEATAMGLAFLTAGRPASWQVASDEKIFKAESDIPLQLRFDRWEIAMQAALKAHKARITV